MALETEIEEIKAERKKKAGPFPVLVLEAHGEIDATINNPVQELEDCVVTFDAVDKEAVSRAHQSEIEAMKLAVACESQVPSRFAALSEGTYLIDEAAKIIYSINISGSAEGSTEAVAWYRKAAELGNTDAMYNLGVILQAGSGIAKNETEAVAWYRKAAEAGNVAAMYNLAVMLQAGTGTI